MISIFITAHGTWAGTQGNAGFQATSRLLVKCWSAHVKSIWSNSSSSSSSTSLYISFFYTFFLFLAHRTPSLISTHFHWISLMSRRHSPLLTSISYLPLKLSSSNSFYMRTFPVLETANTFFSKLLCICFTCILYILILSPLIQHKLLEGSLISVYLSPTPRTVPGM